MEPAVRAARRGVAECAGGASTGTPRADDGAYIAYQVVGQGPLFLAWQFDFFGCLDIIWEGPIYRDWFEGLAGFSRLILRDRRGTGVSSRDVAISNLETRVSDLVAVLDAVGVDDSVVLAGQIAELLDS